MNPIVRRDPFEDLFRGFFVRPVEFDGSAEKPQLRIDVTETPEVYTVSADLPGVRKDDIQVDIDGNTVSITAECVRRRETQEGERVLRNERYAGKLSRSFQLAHDVDESSASAAFADGVLTLSLPKKLGSQGKRLAIE